MKDERGGNVIEKKSKFCDEWKGKWRIGNIESKRSDEWIIDGERKEIERKDDVERGKKVL